MISITYDNIGLFEIRILIGDKMIEIVEYNKTHEFWIRQANGKFIKVFYDGAGRITIKRPRDRRKEEVVDAAQKLPGKPKFDFTGLWFTSNGFFVEVEGDNGWVIQEDGSRLQNVRITPDGNTKIPLGFPLNFEVGTLEISKRAYDIIVKKGVIDKKWPIIKGYRLKL